MYVMTDILIKEQIAVIKKATDNAIKSKDSAQKFLSAAGISQTFSTAKKDKKKK